MASRIVLACLAWSGMLMLANADLQAPAFFPLTVGRVKARGWLRDQLQIQLNGLGGHLHYFYSDIRDSTWLGGNATESGGEKMHYYVADLFNFISAYLCPITPS